MINTDSNSPFLGVIGLGGLKAEYKNAGRGRWIGLIFGVLCLLATPVLLLVTAFVAYQTYNESGLYKVLDNAIVPLIGALIAFVIGAAVVISAWRNWRLAAALFDNGVAYQSRTGVQQVNWADVTAVWQRVTRHYTNGVYTGTTHVYTLQTNTGQKIVLDDRLGKGIEELGKAVQRGASNTLFPKYYSAVQNGQRVDFGPLAMDNQKLYAGKKELPWGEIKAVKISKGQISIQKDKGWFSWASVTVPQIPNFLIFYELVGRFTKIVD
jgi:hypothetical protein